MDDDSNNLVEVDASETGENKDEWVEKHARHLQQAFHQWQHPIGIDDQEYQKHLEKELAGYWDDPLLKTLIESI
jgi:hypothetical protein